MNSIDTEWAWPEAPGQSLITEDQWSKISALLKLSNREQQVCRLLMDGSTRTVIAGQLGIKSRTVRQYLEQLHVKLRVNNRVGLVLRVIQVRDSLARELVTHRQEPVLLGQVSDSLDSGEKRF